MKHIKTFTEVTLPYFFTNVKIVAKVIFYEILLVLVVFGVFYITNYKITITPNVQIVSPIGE